MSKINKTTPATEGKWYLLTEGHVGQVCCRCGFEHHIEVALAWKENLEIRPKAKVAIRFFRFVKKEKSKCRK